LTADETGIAKTVDNKLSVGQNQPNPFSGTTTINYTLSTKENVNLTVYNVAGAKVMEINEGVKAAGTHTIQLNASDLTSGVYYYTVTAGNSQITKKMIVY
jgi:flagellar hook assembly protein FlgD